MIIPEDYAKTCLKKYGISVPEGRICSSVEEALEIAARLNNTVVVKAVIPTGGRGKAGGVKICRTARDVKDFAGHLLGSELLGHMVCKLLVEEAVEGTREIYGAVQVDYLSGNSNILINPSGGEDIEAHSDELICIPVEPGVDMPLHQVKTAIKRHNLEASFSDELAFFLVTLVRMAADLDATLLEINPIAVTPAGSLVALDCKLEVDDNAMSRHGDFRDLQTENLSEREARAAAIKVSYVPLNGIIGVITSGAGLGMASMDMLNERGLPPANFLDTGGGISEEMLDKALQLVLEPPEVEGCLINLYGGINRMTEAARGISKALLEINNQRQIVVKILGNEQEEAWDILSEIPNVHVIRVFQTESAVDRLEELLRK